MQSILIDLMLVRLLYPNTGLLIKQLFIYIINFKKIALSLAKIIILLMKGIISQGKIISVNCIGILLLLF
jgi:hypothetical protein